MSSIDPFPSSASEAQWISLDRLQNATALLRRVIVIAEQPESAPLTLTALGYVELYVNGRHRLTCKRNG